MKKKKILHFCLILILFITSLFANGCITINTDKSAIIEVRFHNETNYLTWSPIQGAYQYEILFEDNSVIKSSVTNYDLSTIPYGEYSLKVRAVNVLGSPVSEYSRSIYVKVERPLSEVLDLLSEKYMSANVKVVATKTFLGSGTVYDGSGIIFKKQVYSGNYYTYYCLTNNHVVVPNINPTYSIVDHIGESHQARLVCYSDAYDLAVVTFVSDTNFEVLPLDDKDVSIGDKVLSLGNPLGSMNSVTAGNVTSLSEVVNVPAESGESDYSNVNFAIITHDAKINSGSSGGALISYDFKIVGINFATGNDATTHEYVEGYAVPHAKIKEFLTENDINY